jgi:hypothetical protein
MMAQVSALLAHRHRIRPCRGGGFSERVAVSERPIQFDTATADTPVALTQTGTSDQARRPHNLMQLSALMRQTVNQDAS